MTDPTAAAAAWTLPCQWCGRRFGADRPRPFCTIHCRNLHAWHGGIRPADQLKAARDALLRPQPEARTWEPSA